jgi:hypothetical protein
MDWPNPMLQWTAGLPEGVLPNRLYNRDRPCGKEEPRMVVFSWRILQYYAAMRRYALPAHVRIRLFAGLVLIVLAVLGGTLAEAGGNKQPIAPLHHVQDLQGKPADPFTAGTAKAIVFLFVRPDCPISNRYLPEFKRLQEKFRSAKVDWWLVYPDADLASAAIRQHQKEYGLNCPSLCDPEHELVGRCRVRVTPEAAVFTPEKGLVYHGRIDDRYLGFGKYRAEPTEHDLETTIGHILEGTPVLVTSTTAIGCAISLNHEESEGKDDPRSN